MFAKRGLIKEGSGRYLLLLILALLLTPAIVSAGTGLECNMPLKRVLNHCGSNSIYTPGYGAVELCQVCYQCGLGDTVCPEDYSDGQNETSMDKLTMMMRVPRSAGDRYSVAFDTGNIACAAISGDCDYVQRSTDASSWTLFGNCALNVSIYETTNNENYFRVICKDVPRKAGCERCPDPDCGTILSGRATEVIDGNATEDVTISLTSNNTGLVIGGVGTSDSSGNYEMNAVTGYLNVTCSKPGYADSSSWVYLKKGRNIFDCKMSKTNIVCTSDCYFTDASGNRICSTACDGRVGCGMTPLAKLRCNGRLYGQSVFLSSSVLINDSNGCAYENETWLDCCAGDISYIILPIYAPGGCGACVGPACIPFSPDYSRYNEGNVSNMIVRNYKKEMNGRSVTISIRTYTK